MKKESETKNRIWIGIVGAFIGASIAAIPWIVAYVYAEMILSLLAILIAAGALTGYKKFKGEINENLPIIIVVISILVVTITTLIVIPLLILAKEGYAITLGNLKILYQYNDFTQAIIKDYVISIIFTFLGISGVVTNVKNQLRNDPNDKDIKAYVPNQSSFINYKMVNEIKESFLSLGAMSKETALPKNIIIDELKVTNPKLEFNNLRMQQIIRRYKGKYYFSERAVLSFWYRYLPLYLKIFFIMLVLFLIAMLFS
ncbi:MAG: hypothetical protein ACM3O4_01690 [Ignavibacteriales bacterium]